RFAVRVGAAAVTKPGAQPSYPTRAELEALAPESPQA
ncbi:ribokinase, partial [Streptomyces lydicus]